MTPCKFSSPTAQALTCRGFPCGSYWRLDDLSPLFPPSQFLVLPNCLLVPVRPPLVLSYCGPPRIGNTLKTYTPTAPWRRPLHLFASSHSDTVVVCLTPPPGPASLLGTGWVPLATRWQMNVVVVSPHNTGWPPSRMSRLVPKSDSPTTRGLVWW